MACFVQSDSFHAVDGVNLLLDSEGTGSCAAVRPGPVQGYSRCACPDIVYICGFQDFKAGVFFRQFFLALWSAVFAYT